MVVVVVVIVIVEVVVLVIVIVIINMTLLVVILHCYSGGRLPGELLLVLVFSIQVVFSISIQY